MPCTKSKMLSGGRPSSASTASITLPVSVLEKPRRRKNSVRSSSLRATIRSRAALMPLTKGMGEELAKYQQRRRRLVRKAGSCVFGVADDDLLKIFHAPQIAILA